MLALACRGAPAGEQTAPEFAQVLTCTPPRACYSRMQYSVNVTVRRWLTA